MKKSNKILFFSLILIFTLLALTGCGRNHTVQNEFGRDSFKSNSLENYQGYQNCLEYINNSSFDNWKDIDINNKPMLIWRMV